MVLAWAWQKSARVVPVLHCILDPAVVPDFVDIKQRLYGSGSLGRCTGHIRGKCVAVWSISAWPVGLDMPKSPRRDSSVFWSHWDAFLMSLLWVLDQCLGDESKHVRRVTKGKCVGKVAGVKHPSPGKRWGEMCKQEKTKGWVIGGLIDNGTAVTTICRRSDLSDERTSAFFGTSELQWFIGTHHSCFQLAQPHKYLNSQDDIFNALQLLFCIYIYCNSTYPLVHLSLMFVSASGIQSIMLHQFHFTSY